MKNQKGEITIAVMIIMMTVMMGGMYLMHGTSNHANNQEKEKEDLPTEKVVLNNSSNDQRP